MGFDETPVIFSSTRHCYIKSTNKATDPQNLRVQFCNIRSVCNKINLVSEHLKSNKGIDLLFLTESWLSPNLPDSMVSYPGYNVMRCDRSLTRGGGVLLLYKDGLHVTRAIAPSQTDVDASNNYELVAVDVHCDSYKIRFCCFYVPPKSSQNVQLVKSLCSCMYNLSTLNMPVFFIGDFNFPNIDWHNFTTTNDLSHNLFLEFCQSNCLSQSIQEPTHQLGNILDLLLCNILANQLLLSTSIHPPLASSCDHSLISFSVRFPNTSSHYSTSQYPDFSKANFELINNHLISKDWSPIYDSSLPFQTVYNHFLSNIQQCIDDYVPTKTINNKKIRRRPKHIRQLLKQKLQRYKLYKKDKSFKTAYKEACTSYDLAVNSFYEKTEADLAKNHNSKKFYNYINKKLKSSSTIPPLLNDTGSFLFSDKEKADFLNASFQKNFTEDNKVPLNNTCRQSTTMASFIITETDVLQAVSKANDKLSRTPEGIPTYFIKRIISSIIKPLVYIFNCSLLYNVIPIQWKQAIVVPIFKKGSRSDPKNYRPISLTSSFSRIFESIVFDKVLSHLLSNNLLSSSQFGFLPNRSSCSQMIHCLSKWYQNFFNSQPTNVVYTDIAKAFDSVSHIKLIKVISSYNICPLITKWIENFLRNRYQKVAIGNVNSVSMRVVSGVPQGSVIGPLLFVIFFNDITACIDSTAPSLDGISLFADDAKLFSTDTNKLQHYVNNFISWTENHQLNVAAHKCFMISLKKPSASLNPTPVCINNSKIKSVNKIKDLGIFISEDLKWANHINFLFAKSSAVSYQILKLFKTKNIWTLLKLFKTYVRPHLEFNTPVWSPYLIRDVNKIERVQRNFTKQAFLRCGLSFVSYHDRLDKLNIKSLCYRRVKFDLVFMYKIIYGSSDLNFNDYFFFRNSHYNLRGNSHKIDTLHKFKSSQWSHTFFVRAVKAWNFLPDDVASSATLNSFKAKLNCLDLSPLVAVDSL